MTIGMILEQLYASLDAYTTATTFHGCGQANKETCRDCANLVVDLDWSMAALQIIIVDMEE